MVIKPFYQKAAHKLACMLGLAVIVNLLCIANVIHASFAMAALCLMLIGRAIIMGLDRLDVLNQNTHLKLTDKTANVLLVGIAIVWVVSFVAVRFL